MLYEKGDIIMPPKRFERSSDQKIEGRSSSSSTGQSLRDLPHGTGHVPPERQPPAMQAAMEAARIAMTPEGATAIWQGERYKSSEDIQRDGFWVEGPAPDSIDKKTVEQLMHFRSMADQKRAIEDEYDRMLNEAYGKIPATPLDTGSSSQNPLTSDAAV